MMKKSKEAEKNAKSKEKEKDKRVDWSGNVFSMVILRAMV
jgi:hypothetical protein